MLSYIAIGDAWGAGFEFADPDFVKKSNDLSLGQYFAHPKGEIRPGFYTDDAQMSIANALHLIEKRPWTKEAIAGTFLEVFKRDVRHGYAGGFFRFLQSVNSGEEFIQKINPNSHRNGAAMRAAPIGFLKSIDSLLEYGYLQASVTHDTDIGIASSQAVALISHALVYRCVSKPEMLCEYLNKFNLGFDWDPEWNQPVACDGLQTVNAILTVLTRSKSLSQILTNSVAFTGDTDTVAAVCLGIASIRSDFYINDLPSFLTEKLENDEYGFDYLCQLDKQMMKIIR